VIIDQQYAAAGQELAGLPVLAASSRDPGEGPGLQAHGEREPAALARQADDVDGAAHELDALAADRQAQPCPAVPARRGGLGLGERLEQPLHLFGRDADARVHDLKPHRDPVAAVARARETSPSAATRRWLRAAGSAWLMPRHPRVSFAVWPRRTR